MAEVDRWRIWSADPAGAAPLAALLDGAEVLEALPDAPGEGRLLILHLAPVAALARAMAAGSAPAAAAADWQRDTAALLRLHRAARRQVRLAELSAARANPGAFAALAGVEPPETPLPEPEAEDAVLCLLAQRLILGDARLAALAAELEAASADLTGGAGLTGDDPAAAWRAHGARTPDPAEAQAAARARGEAELLKAQNRAMMEELESLARRRQQLEERLAQTGQGLESFKAQVAELNAAMAALRERMAQKEQALHAAGAQVVEAEARLETLKGDLDRARSDIGALEAEAQARAGALAAAEAEAAGLRAEIERIVTSRSFRLTAPLRRMRALIGGRA